MIYPLNAPLAPLQAKSVKNFGKTTSFSDEAEVRRAIAVTEVLVQQRDPQLAATLWGVSPYSLSTGMLTFVGVTGVYALLCPKTNRLRYVGSSHNIASRYPKNDLTGFRAHKRETGSDFEKWFLEMQHEKVKVKIRVLESLADTTNLFAREQLWINWFKELGLADLNKINTPKAKG